MASQSLSALRNQLRSDFTLQLARKIFFHKQLTTTVAKEILEQIKERGFLSDYVYNYYLSAIARKVNTLSELHNEFQKACEIFEKKDEVLGKEIYLQFHATKHEVQQTFAILDDVIRDPKGKLQDYLNFTYCIIQLGKTSEIIDRFAKIWEELENRPNVEKGRFMVYSTFIKQYLEAENKEAALSWFEKKKKHGVGENELVYGYFLEAAVKKENKVEVQYWLSEMKKEGVKLNVVLLNLLIFKATQKGDRVEVQHWMNEMRKEGLKPNEITCNIMLAFSKRQNDKKEEKFWMDKLRNDSSAESVSVQAFTQRIQLAVDSNKFGNPKMWRAKMAEVGITPDGVTYGVLIDGALKGGYSAEAEKLANEAKESGRKLNLRTLNALIDDMALRGNKNGVLEWMEEMQKQGINPNAQTFASLMRRAEAKGEKEEAEEWLKKSRDFGVKHTIVTYNVLIDINAKKRDVARTQFWFDQIRKEGLKPTDVTYSNLMQTKPGDLEEGQRLLQEMKNEGWKPNIITYNILLTGATKTGNKELEEYWFGELQKEGLKPDKITYNLLVAAAKQRESEKVGQLVKEMKEKGIKVDPWIRGQKRVEKRK